MISSCALGLEQRLVEHGRVPVSGHDFCDVVVDVPNLVPEPKSDSFLVLKGVVSSNTDVFGMNERINSEPVAELDRLDLVNVADEHEQLERRFSSTLIRSALLTVLHSSMMMRSYSRSDAFL